MRAARTAIAGFCLLLLGGCAAPSALDPDPSLNRAMGLPRDHGSHPEFPNEWWYVWGQLEDDTGRARGFHLALFRRETSRDLRFGWIPVRWYSNPAYFAHFSMVDPARAIHLQRERIGRPRNGGARSSAGDLDVCVGDWTLRREAGSIRLHAAMRDMALDLVMRPTKPPVLNGIGGLSPRTPTHSSHHISLTRLDASGRIQCGSRERPTHGSAWCDHEFLGRGMNSLIAGWDWFALQIDDRTELMLYRLRHADGLIDPLSSGVLIRADGTPIPIRDVDCSVRATAYWRSSKSHALYPVGWELRVPSLALRLDVRAELDDQEFRGFCARETYWEGLVAVHGHRGERRVTGHGYAELTGYRRAMRQL